MLATAAAQDARTGGDLLLHPDARPPDDRAVPRGDRRDSSRTRDDLAEWFGGEWEFKEFEELLVEHPEIPRRILLQDPVFLLAPGGEPFAAFQRRVVGAVEGALAAHPEGDLWVVCHGGVINAYLASFLGLHEQEMFFLPPNTSINTVKVRDRRASRCGSWPTTPTSPLPSSSRTDRRCRVSR